MRIVVSGRSLPPLTLCLIGASVAVTLLSGFGDHRGWRAALFISHFSAEAGLPEIRAGEVWRLITPVFFHFFLLHLVFNMLWLWELGRAVEFAQSTARLAFLFVVLGIFSNLGQFLAAGPAFGGMSGVIYGLLGYVWVYGRLHPQTGMALPKPVAILMLAWFALCWTGLLGPIGNVSHTVGLVLGMIIGAAGAGLERLKTAN